MMGTGTALANEGRSNELKTRVWEVAQNLMQRIEDGTIDEHGVRKFGIPSGYLDGWERVGVESDCSKNYWKQLVETNELTDIGIDEMIHQGD